MQKKIFFILLLFYGLSNLSLWATPTEKKADSTRPKIGVVLSGGGAKGIAHIGILKMLEDLGIPIDYIAGTSMGSIVGGLYAMGYSASELDSTFRAAQWSFLLNDAPLRNHLGISEKLQGVYQLNLRFGKKGISLIPIGVIEGQHIDNLFSKLTLNSYNVKNFSELNIPFFCVGTDIITGEGVILDSGNLAKAMRASMAVPTVFTPINIEDHILVDGGLVNNFPVQETRNRGADIIIGVDVGYRYLKNENVHSFMNILEQSLFLNSMNKNASSIKSCDIYIRPEIDNYTSYNFNMVDSLLSIGYRAADSAYPQLKALADQLSKYTIHAKPHCIHPITSIEIDSIAYIGSNKYSPNFVDQYLQVSLNKKTSITHLENGIQRLYGSSVYDKVTYFLTVSPKDSTNVILNLELIEAPINELKVGARYDNTRGPALLAGAVFRNLGFKNSRLDINLELSRIPVIDIGYMYTPTWTRKKTNFSYWRPSVGLRYLFFNLRAYSYSLESATMHQKTSEYTSITQRATLFAQINVKNNILGLSFNLDYTYTNQSIGVDGLSENSFYLYPSLFYIFDSYNQKYYPTKGCKMHGNISYFDNLRTHRPEYENHFASIFFEGDFAIKLTKKMVLYPGFMVGGTFFTTGGKIPSLQYVLQGGLIPFSHLNSSSFIGLNYMQAGGLFGINAKVNLQYEVFKNTYLSARFAIGKTNNKLEDFVDFTDLIFGGGLSVSYSTPVGPIGITFQGSNYRPFSVFFNFGYWF
ncbi:MAG: patatin-like phospholipase family protein [Bacteroidales bacterium]